MYNRTDVIYVYDGTFEGFLCCVYNHYYNYKKPVDIVTEENFEYTLFEHVHIDTEIDKSEKVAASIKAKISQQSYDFIEDCFYSCLVCKEKYMLRYIIQGFIIGSKIFNLLGDDNVSILKKAHLHLMREVHRYLGLVRFYKAEDIYISVITPKNKILKFISYHFSQRFSNQTFMIYDKNHNQALFSSRGETVLADVDGIDIPEISDNEIDMQILWKQFYDTIAIKERTNHRARMNFMPKRTWEYLPEMQNLQQLKETKDKNKFKV